MKFYAIKKGHKTGIFNSWEECKSYITGYSGSVYKSFKSREQAEEYLELHKKQNIVDTELSAYVDGSYNKATEEFSYGIIIFEEGNLIFKDNKGFKNEFSSMRNVAGEVYGSTRAIEYALKQSKSISIYYDYMGIEHWAENSWKAKNELTKKYQNYAAKAKERIEIKFVKVKAHTGDYYNEMVDRLAKEAIF